MNLLLDTHIAIWARNDDSALSEKARALRNCRKINYLFGLII